MQATTKTLPTLAIITNGPTPYRTHFHQRIVREIPELRLLSIFTHEVSNSPWSATLPPEINPIMFGSGQIATESPARTIGREWAKGGRVIGELARQDVRAVVVYGYADAGRLRIIRWCRQRRIPCFVWGDSNMRSEVRTGTKARLKRVVLRRVLSWSSGVMCCGSLGQEYFEHYGVDPKRIYWVPYEPDYAMVGAINPQQIADVKNRFNLDDGRRRIVYSGRLAPVKRVDLAIDAFVRLAAERPMWDLIIVGDGPLGPELRLRVPVQLKDRVIWTGFLDDQATISALYRASDILILPSDYEPWALVINEAAAAGLAIIASDVVGAAAELVRDGVNGFTFTHGDLQQLIDVMRIATDEGRLETTKAASAGILQDWIRRADPVAGLRRALSETGILG
ncbi:MAG: glycosyltransferase family 4 protein [Burkholderiales bacterium]|nr:glycosyltransferase family 4 protein [Phycisphaerae bacterium]